MKSRLDYARAAPGVYDAMEAWTSTSALAGWTTRCFTSSGSERPRSTGAPTAWTCTGRTCARSARAEQRLYSLDAWRECPYYTDRERAALAWTEAVTLIADGHVPDAVYEEVRPHFSEKELSDLTLAVATINAWNRLSIAARLVPAGTNPPLWRADRRGRRLRLSRRGWTRRDRARRSRHHERPEGEHRGSHHAHPPTATSLTSVSGTAGRGLPAAARPSRGAPYSVSPTISGRRSTMRLLSFRVTRTL